MNCSKFLHRFIKWDKENTIPIHRQGSECEKKVPKNKVFHKGPIFILLVTNFVTSKMSYWSEQLDDFAKFPCCFDISLPWFQFSWDDISLFDSLPLSYHDLASMPMAFSLFTAILSLLSKLFFNILDLEFEVECFKWMKIRKWNFVSVAFLGRLQLLLRLCVKGSSTFRHIFAFLYFIVPVSVQWESKGNYKYGLRDRW